MNTPNENPATPGAPVPPTPPAAPPPLPPKGSAKGGWIYLVIGLVCVFAPLSCIAVFGQNLRALTAASANALGGDEKSVAQAPSGFGRKALRFSADEAPMAAAPAPAMEMEAKEERARGGGGMAMPKMRPKKDMAADKKMAVADGMLDQEDDSPSSGEGGAAAAAPTRAWFPETFVFEPLIATDATGRAEYPVRVPDRLTNWRVLALAFSREGAQAGAVTSFRGTLPAYVDPVVPGFLLAGDEVRLPIQVVNTTDREISQLFAVEAESAKLEYKPKTLGVPASGSVVEYATLKADRPGEVSLKATLGSTDSVRRAIPVQPAGKLVEIRRGGTLAAPREVELEAPANLEADSAQVRLTVYPGALALLRSELAASLYRSGVADDSYSLLLSGRADALLKSLGSEADPLALRNLAVVSGQRVIRHARRPAVEQAAMMTEAALLHRDNPVLSRLAERLAEQLAQAQRPDGTFSGGNGWTLQRLLVVTADCVRAVRVGSDGSTRARQRAIGASLRASGAFERNVDMVPDAYTAAAILASGTVEGTIADKLRTRVREAVQAQPDGTRALPVEEGVVRGDGSVPSEVEATALAVLALEGDPKATWRADLAAYVLARYSASWGWGDGQTNLHALRAILATFKEPLPKQVKITLAMDGKPVKDGTFDAAQLKDVLSLEAPASGAAGKHTWTIAAEPAVPGLGYALTLMTYVPWEKQDPTQGLELVTNVPAELKVGLGAEVSLEASAPSGKPLRLRHALPAGVQPDRPSLDALVSSGAVTSFRTEDGAVTFELSPREPGQVFQAKYRVVPTLGGTLRAGASSLSIADRSELAYYVPPTTWKVQ